jgi:hypothetical protein
LKAGLPALPQQQNAVGTEKHSKLNTGMAEAGDTKCELAGGKNLAIRKHTGNTASHNKSPSTIWFLSRMKRQHELSGCFEQKD